MPMTMTADNREELMGKTVFARLPMPISEYRVWGMLVSALEGGSNYWYRVDNTKLLTPEGQIDMPRASLLSKHVGVEYIHQIPLIEGFGLILEELSDESERDPDKAYTVTKYPLNRKRLLAGLKIMADKHPRHWANFISENDDAETGDVFLQLACLGKIVYG